MNGYRVKKLGRFWRVQDSKWEAHLRRLGHISNVHVHVQNVAQPPQICLPLRVLDPSKSAQLPHGGVELVCWERTWAFWEWIWVLWEGMCAVWVLYGAYGCCIGAYGCCMGAYECCTGTVWVLYGYVRVLYGCIWVLPVCCMGAVWVEMGDGMNGYRVQYWWMWVL